jgi:hypothetical protein
MRLLSLLAFLGFGASLIVHAVTFLGVDLSQTLPWVWGLHIGIFVVCIPMAFSARSLGRRGDYWLKLLALMPRWVLTVIIAFFIYAFVNFGLFLILSEGGVPEELDGKYVLYSHGKVIRELTEEEFHLQQAYVIRGFSGHWMVFYLIPAVYFLYSRPRQRTMDGATADNGCVGK